MNALLTILGKLVRAISRIFGNNGASLPGYFIERLDKNYLSRMLSQLPGGVVVVTGTNGKTTTTKMIAEVLRANDRKVLSNSTGSNFTRGVISMLVQNANISGRLASDIAVLELDEAYAVQFCRLHKPRGVVLLNVMRDQLDRFGEIDITAGLLQKVADSTQEFVVLNESDERVANIDVPKRADTEWFGVSSNLAKHFPTDDKLYANDTDSSQIVGATKGVVLSELEKGIVSFRIGKDTQSIKLEATGPHNALNAAAACAALRILLPNNPTKKILADLSQVNPAFGRGEQLTYGKTVVRLQLVKNPAGFAHAMREHAADAPDCSMICINDNHADSRDVSWLWDVDFRAMQNVASEDIFVSGSRAFDMAQRLHYDDVKIEVKNVAVDLEKQLDRFLSYLSYRENTTTATIYCTYTAMWRLNKLLVKRGLKEAAR